MKLNGWQRLWCVVTVLYGLVVAGITWAEWPQRSVVRTFKVTAEEAGKIVAFDLLWGGQDPPTKDVAGDIHYGQLAAQNGGAPVGLTYISAVSPKNRVIYFPADTPKFIVDREVARYGSGPWPERRNALLRAFAIWLVPMGLYTHSERRLRGSFEDFELDRQESFTECKQMCPFLCPLWICNRITRYHSTKPPNADKPLILLTRYDWVPFTLKTHGPAVNRRVAGSSPA